ncbi:MAG: SusC/RagA family TonB-linked outer membrane protein [Mucilaginibacter sp.]
MKKLLLVSLCLLALCVTHVFAQSRTVTGTVTAKEDGLPLPGVTVKIKGTNSGVSTDANGKFSIIAQNATVLTFSYVAYLPQDIVVGNNSVINVVLSQDNRQLNEVVVTALGVSREKKSLGYASSTVRSEEINQASPVSMFGGLQGKIPGVTISNTGGSVGGSTKVIIRGYSSISGSNQPLYVVDGVPFDNSRPGSGNTVGALDNYDFGNGGNDIDPNNIDAISILKGSAATALYGSRGSNGVILITTKKGKAGKLSVDFSTATKITDVASIYTPQTTFGQGWDASLIVSENGNWGPKFDGKIRPWGSIVDNSQLLKPYSYIKDNVKNAFDKGFEETNSLAISGGSENAVFRIAYSNVYDNGILPGNADTYRRNNISLGGSVKFGKFTAEGSMEYINKYSKVPATGQGDNTQASFYEDILQIPGDIPIKDLRNYKNKFFNVDNYFTPWAENPYYTLFENGSIAKNDRLFGNINLQYKATDWLTLQVQQGADVTNLNDKIWSNYNNPTPGSNNAGGNVEGGVRAEDIGKVIEESHYVFQYDTKINALINKKINRDFDVNGLIGVNYNDRGSRDLSTEIKSLAIPGFYQISNSLNDPQSTEAETHRRLFGAYASATVGYKNYLYLTLSGRNDWSSTLPAGANSYFYPAASLAFDLTDALNAKSDILSYAKLRASVGKTGSDTDPYRILNTLSSTNVPLSYGHILFPLNGGVAGYSVTNTLNNDKLKPEIQTEYELGGEFRFFNNAVGLDFTYYDRVKDNQILPVPIAPSSGYSTEILNFGKVRNRGVEIGLNLVPVKTKDFKWALDYSFTRNRNVVLSLPAGLSQVVLNSSYGAQFVAIVGQPLGVFKAPVPAYDPQGHIIVGSTGFPVTATDNGVYGTSQHDFQMGLTNTFTYKSFGLEFDLDYRQGGKFYSGTADLLNFVGADPATLYNDRRPWIVPNSVQAVTGSGGAVTYVTNTTPISEANVDDYYYHTSNEAQNYQRTILDATFVKLRQVALSYTLPKSISNKINAQRLTLSVYGTNLYTWLPKSNHDADPETTNQGIDLASDFGEFRTAPPLRYYGASLKVTF